ncbi:hypothetical protein J4416_02410 [Candidatus Pacearchaeota archaeon]|nr:hypothetical protein [Candidatus Pacearchaeota archaeon]
MNRFFSNIKKFWHFLKQDTWKSWIVSLVLAFIFIKFIFFPLLSWVFLTPLPLVVVESCSMYHQDSFDSWWLRNGVWYEAHGIDKEEFEGLNFKNGLNKGDIILVSGRGRLVRIDPYDTKGDNNFAQLPEESNIEEDQFVGKAIGRIPGIGWIKLIFFEGAKPSGQRGFCK